jgi:hypothetical protein
MNEQIFQIGSFYLARPRSSPGTSRADKPSTRCIRLATAQCSTPTNRPSSPTARDQARVKDQPDKTGPAPTWPRFQPAQVAWIQPATAHLHCPTVRARARERGINSVGRWGSVVQSSPISSLGVRRSPMYPGTMMNSSGTSRTPTPDMRVTRPPRQARPGRCCRRGSELASTRRVDQALPSSSGPLCAYPHYFKAVVSVSRSWAEKVDVCRTGPSFPCRQITDGVSWVSNKAAVLAGGRRDSSTEVRLHA